MLRAVAPKSEPDRAEPDGDRRVSLGHDRSTLAISNGVVCDFTRVLEWGGAKIETAIGRDLGLTVDEAEELKLDVSLLDADVRRGGDPRVIRARTSVRRELTALARELVASLQFYQSQPDSLPIGEILLTGGTTRLPGPRRRAGTSRECAGTRRGSARLGRGRRGDRASRRSRLAGSRDRSGGGAVMEAVNLLPPEHRPAGRLIDTRRRADARPGAPDRRWRRGAVVVLFLASFYVYERSAVSSKQNALASQQAQLAAIQTRAQVVKDAENQVAARMPRRQFGHRGQDGLGLGARRSRPRPARWRPVELTAGERTCRPGPPVAPVAPTSSRHLERSSSTTAETAIAPVAPAAPATDRSRSRASPRRMCASHLILDRLALLPWLSNVSLQTSSRQTQGCRAFHRHRHSSEQRRTLMTQANQRARCRAHRGRRRFRRARPRLDDVRRARAVEGGRSQQPRSRARRPRSRMLSGCLPARVARRAWPTCISCKPSCPTRRRCLRSSGS